VCSSEVPSLTVEDGLLAVRGVDWCVRTWLPALLRALAMGKPAQRLAEQPTPRSWDDLAELGLHVHAIDQRWAELASKLTVVTSGLRCSGACARLRMVRSPAAAVALRELAGHLPAGSTLAAPIHHRGHRRHHGTAAERALARWETERTLRRAGAAGAAATLAVTIALGDELAHTATVLAAGSAARLEAAWRELGSDLDRQLPGLQRSPG
jgi:hypothetical protein